MFGPEEKNRMSNWAGFRVRTELRSVHTAVRVQVFLFHKPLTDLGAAVVFKMAAQWSCAQ